MANDQTSLCAPAHPCTCTHADQDHCVGHIVHYSAKTGNLMMGNHAKSIRCKGRHCEHPLCSCIEYTIASRSVARATDTLSTSTATAA
jgi:hypothetical protein